MSGAPRIALGVSAWSEHGVPFADATILQVHAPVGLTGPTHTKGAHHDHHGPAVTAARAEGVDQGGVFRVPDSDLAPIHQLAALTEQRNRIIGWIRNIAVPNNDIQAIVVAVRSADQARRVVASRRLGRTAITTVQEVARSAERAMYLAIEEARERGVLTRAGGRYRSGPGPRMLADYGLTADDTRQAARLARGVSDGQFEAAVQKGRADNDLSRVHLAAILRDGVFAWSSDRATRVQQMAETGHTSAQIADQLGSNTGAVRVYARQQGISIPADRVMRKTRRTINPERVVGQTVAALEGLRPGLGLLSSDDYDELPPDQLRAWLGSLTDSLSALRTLTKELNDRVHRN